MKISLLGTELEVEGSSSVQTWLTRRFVNYAAPSWPHDIGIAPKLQISKSHQGKVWVHQEQERMACVHLLDGRIELREDCTPIFADAAVRIACSWQLAEQQAILLHASAIEQEKGAVVVFGSSGVGKSSFAKHFPSLALADELVVLKKEGVGRDAQWIAHGTPWWKGRCAQVKLGKMIWLVRGEEPSTKRIQGALLLRALVRETARYIASAPHELRIFSILTDLASHGGWRVAAGENRVLEALEKVIDVKTD